MVVELERRRLCEDLIIHSGTRIKEVGFGHLSWYPKMREGAGGSSRPSCLGPITGKFKGKETRAPAGLGGGKWPGANSTTH